MGEKSTIIWILKNAPNNWQTYFFQHHTNKKLIIKDEQKRIKTSFKCSLHLFNSKPINEISKRTPFKILPKCFGSFITVHNIQYKILMYPNFRQSSKQSVIYIPAGIWGNVTHNEKQNMTFSHLVKQLWSAAVIKMFTWGLQTVKWLVSISFTLNRDQFNILNTDEFKDID